MNRLLAFPSPIRRLGFCRSKPLPPLLLRPVSARHFSISNDEPKNKGGIIDKFFGKTASEASPEFSNRWAMAVPAFVTHMCIGSPWAWSLVADVITRENGVVASVASDWTLGEAAFPLSLVFGILGFSAAGLGPWQQKVGVRKALLAGSFSFGGGLGLASLGIHCHMLPLVYAGYGVLGGTALGLCYTPPIQTLVSWFTDKKGTATGITIAGFGSGALLFTPAMQALMSKFSVLPEYIGPTNDHAVNIDCGNLFVEINGKAVQVVEALTSDLAKLPYEGLQEGLYVVGSGSTGAAEALAVMGATYFSLMLASALTIKTPHPSFVPGGAPPSNLITAEQETPTPSTSSVGCAVPDVPVMEAIRSPQFHLLGITFTALATGGMGIFSVAKPMMSEVFNGALPDLVTSAFAAKFLLTLSAANLGGRLAWASLSDQIGRRKTFMIFTLSSVPLYLSIPSFIDMVVENGESLPIYGFVGSSVLCISMMGGTYAILPAYEADLYGAKNLGPTHGVMMLYSAAAAILGPSMLLQLRSMSELKYINELLQIVSDDKFLEKFGTPIEHASELVANKTVTIAKLLSIAPSGTIDPTPHLYDTTMYSLAGLAVVATLAHSRVTPYVPKEILIKSAVEAEDAKKLL